MNNSAKRLLSLAMVLVMALSMLPVFAFAADMTPAEIVDAAYDLAVGESMTEAATLTGVITSIDTAYSSQYKNITVTIAVAGCEDKPIKCFRLKGDGADTLTAGDTITVTGTLSNYNGIIEFLSGCTLDAVVKGEGEVVEAPEDPLEIVDAAYALEPGAALPYEATLTGTITEIVTAYNETYKNVSVNMVVAGREDKPILCYRMKGTGADTLEVGYTITVTGTIKNYTKTTDGVTTNTIEFDTGCALIAVDTGEEEEPVDYAAIVDAAYALETGKSMSEKSTLQGVITSVDTPYSSIYSNITVTIAVAGKEDKPIQCYRMKGDGINTLAEGDTITVTGTLTNYKDTIQFKQGCTLDAVVKGENEAPVAPENPLEIVDAAYALAPTAYLPYEATLTGNVIEITKAYNEEKKNISVNMAVAGREDKPILCYDMIIEDATMIADLAEGDIITVIGNLKNYAKTTDGVTTETIEFTPCKLISVEKAPAGVAVTGAVTCFGDAAVAATVELWVEGAEAAAYTATVADGAYAFENVAAGTYTLKVSKASHVTREYELVVAEEAAALDVEIHLIGDINGDGRVNTGDVSKIYAHAKKSASLEGYEFACADINGDGRVNTGDTSKAYAHAKKTTLLW